jgi:hypothetical protein
LVLYDPPANFPGQPKVIWERGRIGTVHAPHRLIGTLGNHYFLFGFTEFGQ